MFNLEVCDGGLELFGIKVGIVYLNWNEVCLYEEIIWCGEGEIVEGGVLVVKIGEYIGWFVKDKFMVCDVYIEDQVWWDNNVLILLEYFLIFWNDFCVYMEGKEFFV